MYLCNARMCRTLSPTAAGRPFSQKQSPTQLARPCVCVTGSAVAGLAAGALARLENVVTLPSTDRWDVLLNTTQLHLLRHRAGSNRRSAAPI